MKKSHFLLLYIFFVISCCTSDFTKDLGGGYFYRNEGGLLKDILCEDSQGDQIPATIIDYAYNDLYIIAKQKPKRPADALYSKEYKYSEGNNKLYYWIIIKKVRIVLGPLDKIEFEKCMKKYKIPEDLILKD